ncbi:zf-HC2 domain-containing protein [Candidatus Bipolaricaulota bacterium]|nr:zf-HC2 domain-containing protein [Candidatus Bipolaricaulota bacterium]
MSECMNTIENRNSDLAPIDCLEAKELMPWFVTGALTPEQDDSLAAHLSHCPRCQRELIEVVQLQNVVSSQVARRPSVRDESWKRIRSEALASDITEINVGTLLLGFRLGIRSAHGRSSVDGSVRVLGRGVRVLGPSTRYEPAKRKHAALDASKPRSAQRGAEEEENDV